MEANLMIKSFKAEGKKITDLQFYGDMEIDISEAPTEVKILPKYIETRPLNGDIYSYGTLMKEIKHENGKYYFKFRNDSPWPYYCVFESTGGILRAMLPPARNWEMRMTDNFATSGTARLYVFTEDQMRCVGIVNLSGLI